MKPQPLYQVPASMIQHQFWLIDQLHPGNTAYSIASAFDIQGPLDAKKLKACIGSIAARHEILRTTFSQYIGQVFQNINPTTDFELPVFDIGLTSKEAFDSTMQDEIQRPFDLERGPLIRALLYKKCETDHTLLIVQHHIVTDLRSKELFAQDLATCYNGPARMPAEQMTCSIPQYKEYAEWQLDWLKSSAAEKMALYWQQELKSHSGMLNLPIDLPRPSVQTLKGSCRQFHFESNLAAKLREFSSKSSTDIFLILLAAYAALLFKYSKQNDIVIGVPLTNRRQNTHKESLGCFVNILPISLELSADLPFTELLKQVRMKMLMAHRNQELPFTKILEVVQPQRFPGTNPLFQVGFTVEPSMPLALDNLKIRPRHIHNRGAQLDLFLTFQNITTDIRGHFEFNSDLFFSPTIEGMCRNYQNLLQSLTQTPEAAIGQIGMLSPNETRRIIFDFNDTAAPVPQHARLHTLFEDQAAKTPQAVSVTHAETSLSYANLNLKANQLSHFLKGIGIARGDCVGIHLHRSPDMLVAILGVLKAGAVYVPLDPAFPKQRLEYILQDTRAPVLITHSDLSGDLDTPGIRSIIIDRDNASIACHSEDNPKIDLRPEDLAYILHTSGSTGKPKGVQVPHIAVVNFLLSMQKEPGITAEDTLLAVTTLSFDISVLELFLPLTVGARIVLADQHTTSDGQALLHLIRSCGATIMQATPATWHLLFAAGLNRPLPLKILCGGENLPPGLARQLCSVSTSVWNLYGPTETTIWSTCAKIEPDAPITAGRPIANTQIYIVDANLQLVPPGIPGELLIGGLGVSRGYLNRPELNAEKFIADPFREGDRQRLYRTGDIARMHHDGTLQIFGRMDHQIKLRGFRIELGEIEAQLSKHPAVEQVALRLYEKSPQNKRLVAYFTAKPDQHIDINELRGFLKKQLPDYMLPSVFNQLDRMPLTDNGKIDRKSLPQPILQTGEAEACIVLPRTEMEKVLHRLWQSLLEVEMIGIHDNFFEIGGNSLLAVEASILIANHLKKKIPVADLFQYTTIATLAEHLTQQSHTIPTGAIDRAKMQRQALIRKRRKIQP